jgi:hypothetical protein
MAYCVRTYNTEWITVYESEFPQAIMNHNQGPVFYTN